jgi:hypothetical protein
MSEHYVVGTGIGHSCNCVGPQNGQPACPCAMRNVRVVDGRYVKINDLGPVTYKSAKETPEEEIARLEKRLKELRGPA